MIDKGSKTEGLINDKRSVAISLKNLGSNDTLDNLTKILFAGHYEEYEKEFRARRKDCRDKLVNKYVEKVIRGRNELVPGPQMVKKIWLPKNKEVSRGESDLDKEFWKTSGFPKYMIPEGVETHVRKRVWTQLGQKYCTKYEKEETEKAIGGGARATRARCRFRSLRAGNKNNENQKLVSNSRNRCDQDIRCLMVTSEGRAHSRTIQDQAEKPE